MNIYKYKNGTTGKREYRFDKIINGKRLARQGFKTKREAAEALQEGIQELKQKQQEQQERERKTRSSLLRLCNEYLKYAEKQFAKGTFRDKLRVTKAFLSHWGRVDFPEPLDVLKFLQTRAEISGHAFNTARKDLHAMFKWGEEFELCDANPVSKIRKAPYDQPPKYVPSLADVQKVFEVAGPHCDLLQTCLYLAARKTEIFQLQWQDVDFERRRVTLWTRKRKSRSREADLLHMSDPLFGILKRRYEAENKHSHWVFENQGQGASASETGRYMRLSGLLRRLCAKAKVKPFTWHALRHLSASVLAASGLEAPGIQKMLRHKSLAMTQHYLHELRDSTKEAADILGGQIGGEPVTQQNESHNLESQPDLNLTVTISDKYVESLPGTREFESPKHCSKNSIALTGLCCSAPGDCEIVHEAVDQGKT